MPAITPVLYNGIRILFWGHSLMNPIPPGAGGDASNDYNAYFPLLVQHPKPSLALPNSFVPYSPTLPAQVITSGRSKASPDAGIGSAKSGINANVVYMTFPGLQSSTILSPANTLIAMGYDPQLIVIDAATNDAIAAVAAATTAGIYDTCLNTIRSRSRFANIPIIIMSVAANGEQWAAGPPRLTGGEPAIGNTNTAIAAKAALYSCVSVDLRTPLLAQEQILQPVAASSVDRGFLFWDGIHPNAAGKKFIADQIAATLTYT